MNKLNKLLATKAKYRSKFDQAVDWVLMAAGVVLVMVVLTMLLDTAIREAAVLWP